MALHRSPTEWDIRGCPELVAWAQLAASAEAKAQGQAAAAPRPVAMDETQPVAMDDAPMPLRPCPNKRSPPLADATNSPKRRCSW